MKNNKRMTNWGIVTMVCSLVLLLFLSTLSLLETQTAIKKTCTSYMKSVVNLKWHTEQQKSTISVNCAADKSQGVNKYILLHVWQ